MLILKELRFKGIGRFVEEQAISFDKFGSLIQVDGKNTNTGGSSGAAKSTVFNALEFLFGLNSIPNTVLQSRLSDDSLSVEGIFDLDGKPLTISRGKKLKIDIDGEIVTGSSKLTEEKLDQILAIPRHLFRPMLHKRQGEKGFFLNFTPKETNDFLTDCLNLGHFKKHVADLDLKASDLVKKRDSLLTNIESSKAGLKASQDATAALGNAPVKTVDQDAVVRLKTIKEASEGKLQALLLKQRVEADFIEKERPVPMSVKFDSSNRLRLEKEAEDIKNQMNTLLLVHKDKENQYQLKIQAIKGEQQNLVAESTKINNAREEARKIGLSIKKIRESICPTCEQHWATVSAKTEEEKLLKKLNDLKAMLAQQEMVDVTYYENLKALKDLQEQQLPAVPDGYKELREKEREIKSLIANEYELESQHSKTVDQKNRLVQSEFNNKKDTLNALFTDEIKKHENQVSLDRRALDAAISNMRSYEEAKTRYENSFKKLKEQEYLYLEREIQLNKELISLNSELELCEELKKAIKSYLSCSFDEALESISENATKIIHNIPNMATATVQLEGIKETKEGKLKEEVNANIYMDGEANIDIRSLSGGERASLDLAIDLSVIDLIENKTNKGINMFILDEPFNGLEAVNIEMVLEMLKNTNTNKKLVIVDHNPIVKEQISDRITVVRTGEISCIER